MKLLLENWSNYQKYPNILEDPDYITNFLGIQTALLESNSQHYLAEVYKEQILYEGILDSIKNFIAKKTGAVKDLVQTIGMAIINQDNATKFSKLLDTKIIEPIFNNFRKVFKLLKLDELLGLIKQYIINPIKAISSAWKKIFAATAAGVLLTYAWDQISPFLPDIKNITGKGFEELQAKIKDTIGGWLKGKIGIDLIAKLGELTDINAWFRRLGPIVGGIPYLASALAPATEAFVTIAGDPRARRQQIAKKQAKKRKKAAAKKVKKKTKMSKRR